MTSGFSAITAEQSSAELEQLMGNPGRMMISQIVFLCLTGFTVAAGAAGAASKRSCGG